MDQPIHHVPRARQLRVRPPPPPNHTPVKSLVCDNCLKPAGKVRLTPPWSQLVLAQDRADPKVFHLCREVCLLEFVNSKGWEDPE